MKAVIFVLVLAAAFFEVASNEEIQRPIVETSLGKLRGIVKKTFANHTYTKFEGIPFAKPPVGARRFQEPEPIERWEGIWDATTTYECAQNNLLEFEMVQGTEDCLYLNIYIPDTPSDSKNYDVIVHIHGGVFMFGAGHDYAHADYFMDRDVIYVTFNYRLGMLGFLSTQDEILPGNNGLKDQVLALKWIQKHIAKFGGNPNSVTLSGLSSGGSCVHLHYLSNLSKGLFHRGISNSGVALQPIVLQENAREKAKSVASAMGCPESSKELIECLRQRPFQHLMTKIHMLHGYKTMPVTIFGPVVEPKGTKDAFLKEHPYKTLAEGKVADLPWVLSNVEHEGHFPAKFFESNLPEITEKWNDIYQFLLDLNNTLSPDKFQEVGAKIKEFYIGDLGANFTEDNFKDFVRIFSDRYYFYDTETALRLHAKNSKSSVYYYRFSYPGQSPPGNNQSQFVSHGYDGQYFFYNMMYSEPTPNDLKMTKIMMNMLITFVKTGKPAFEGITWEPISSKSAEISFLNVTHFNPDGIKLGSLKELSPRSFWDGLNIKENRNLFKTKSGKDEL